MPMPSQELERLIRQAFPDATIELNDLAGDNDHYSVTVASEKFRGRTRVEQHRMVYDALKGAMTGPLHALSVTTKIP